MAGPAHGSNGAVRYISDVTKHLDDWPPGELPATNTPNAQPYSQRLGHRSGSGDLTERLATAA
jgi:hypothetical protein